MHDRKGAGGSMKGALLVLGAWLCSAAAIAEVTLETSVRKVETTLDGSGQVKRELLATDDVVPGEELRYTIRFTNESRTAVDAERIVITNPIPEGTRYVADSAGGDGTMVEYSGDGDEFHASEAGIAAAAETGPAGDDGASRVHSLRWTYQRELGPDESGEVYFHVRML
ncbi:MAG: hypothetical protein U5Q16_15030 [Gammaproteobacteria bacterium]|nr:hypothetical protein [Gammaproteobacteria bacterium]